MNKQLVKLLSLLLSVLMIFSTTTLAFADGGFDGGTTPSFDETLYEILDYYGNEESMSVVKRVQLNGNKSFVDYGSYSSVNDMTGRAEATISSDSVRFDIEDGYNKNEMFFEAVPKNEAIELPWSYEVSYKLNGVPKKAEDLAGASGVVEINAHCIPNPNIDEYSKNNLLMELAAIVDTQKVLSVEAPGAQQQEVGKYKVVLFTALPAEDITFTIRIGTESFSLLGLFMLVEPGTLAQLQQIKDLRDQLEIFGDTPDLLLGGMGSLLSSVQTIAGGVSGINDSLADLKSAYSEATRYAGDIKSESESVLTQFSTLSGSLSNVVNQLSKLSSAISDAAGKLDGVSGSLNTDGLKSAIENSKSQIGDIRSSLVTAKADFDNILSLISSLEEQAKSLPNSDSIVALLGSLKSIVTTSRDSIDSAIGLLDELSNALNSIEVDLLPAFGADSSEVTQAVQNAVSIADKAVAELNKAVGTVNQSVTSVTSIYTAITNAISDSQTDFNRAITQALSSINTISNGAGELSAASGQLKNVGDSLQTTLDKAISDQTSGSNIIDIDPNATIKSFTSEKNATPSSTQIVLRTHSIGISLTNSEDDVELETPQTPMDRIKLLFKRIANAFKALFA